MTVPAVAATYAGLLSSVPGNAYPYGQANLRQASGVAFQNVASNGDYVSLPVDQAARTTGTAVIGRKTSNGGNNGVPLAQLMNSAGIAVLQCYATASNTWQFQYWNGTAWVNLGASIQVANNTFYRIAFYFQNLGSSTTGALICEVQSDAGVQAGTAAGTALNLSAVTNVVNARSLTGYNATTSILLYDIILRDGDGRATYSYSQVATSNGTDATDGTGTYTDVTKINNGTPEATFMSLPTSGNRRSFKGAARALGGRSTMAVGFEGRLRCGSTGPTQIKPYLLIGGTRYYHASSPVTLSPSFLPYSFLWTLDPSTGAAWTAANSQAAALEWGIEVA